MVNELNRENLKNLYKKTLKPPTKFNGSTYIQRNRTRTLETINLPINSNTVKQFLNINKNYFYLGSHGYIDMTKPKKKIPLIRTPPNVSIVFIAPVGMSISEKLNANSKMFYMSNELLEQFHKNHDKFLENKKIPLGLKKCIIVPPNAYYLDYSITFKPRNSLSKWEANEFGLFKVPYGRRTKRDLLYNHETKKMYKKNINRKLSKGDEEDVYLSEIVNSFLNGKNKGGILFVDTCRIIWTQIKGIKNFNRVCRLTGRRHCKTTKQCYPETANNTNGRSISIYPSRMLSKNEIQTRNKLSLDKILLYKHFEEKRSNLFKKLLSKTNISQNIMNYETNVRGLKNIKLNHSLNYTKHTKREYINLLLNHLRSLHRQGIPLSYVNESKLKTQMLKKPHKTPLKFESWKLKEKVINPLNRRLYKINE